jgi:2-polyprenyl-3-methyl-5-hydroxy-6-metoxy-1,4-benzoquinol methylase
MSVYGISDQVQSQYNLHPYPGYPLWIPLRWQEGYIGASVFSRRLCEDLLGTPSLSSKDSPLPILVIGCGDTQMAILRKVEPVRHAMIGVDFSRKNIRRTRFRMWNSFRHCELKESDLNFFLQNSRNNSFSHIDAYGVLHHLPDPSTAFAEIARCLQVGGTLRLMVYNTPARRWIHALQKLFRSLGLTFHKESNVRTAQQFLDDWCKISPALQVKCKAVGPSLLAHRSRFVDTFLHAREARLSPTSWVQSLLQVGLTPIGLLDRYGEWDMHPNPLWQFPTAQALEEQADSGAYPNFTPSSNSHRSRFFLSPLHVRTPPVTWFSFPETAPTPRLERFLLWWRYINYVYGGKKPTHDPAIPVAAAQRLARIGALLPEMVSPSLQKDLNAPMQAIKSNTPMRDTLEKSGFLKMSLDDMHFLVDKAETILRNQGKLTSQNRRLIRARIEMVQALVEQDDHSRRGEVP